ncbi:hypothetical protein FDC35_14060 [Clostridium botulinum]|nr:hypothetical protein [Clostridium botulinum]NFP01967.1 hypothetical protein [Clostridium botulinum]
MIKKLVTSLLITATIVSMNPIGANASWKQDNNGWWNTEGNSWSKGWKNIDGTWYYFNTSNGYMKTGWLNDNGIWYYFNTNGEMVTGNKNIDCKVYSFGNDGKWTGAITINTSENNGWVKEGSEYKYRENGEFAEDWKQIDGDWYYFDAMNMRVTGLAPIRNENDLYVAHQFDDNGKWLGEYKNTNTVQETKKPEDLIQLSDAEFYDEVCKEMFRLVNEHRENNGVAKLEWSDELMESAEAKSQHMSEHNYYEHDWNGINYKSLIRDISNTEIGSENIAVSYNINSSSRSLANELFSKWKNSYGHNCNMLNENWNEFGIGIYKGNRNGYSVIYSTQHFR